jgi:hypothetical protein
MTKATLVGLVSLVAVAGVVTAPAQALADPRHHFKGPSHHHNRLHSSPPQRFFPRRFDDHRHHHHGHRHHGGRSHGFVVVGPPVIVYSPPPVYTPPVYVPEPVYYPPPPPAYSPPASAVPAPTETVIEHPNGRYELRGDGIVTPYRWVWIPNPPSAPPADAAPDVTPKSAPAAPEPRQRTELYRWKDDDGAVHWTDRWEKVPEAYRARATKQTS